MKRLFWLAAALAAIQANAQVDVKIYQPASDTGSGVTFGKLIGSFNSPNIQFGASLSFNWDPVPPLTDEGTSHGAWGADFTGKLHVATTGDYSLTLDSDDGSYLFVNGALVINDGNDHGPNPVSELVHLNAGNTPFEVQFRENAVGTQGVDLDLPRGVTFAAPDSSEFICAVPVLVCAMNALRRRRMA
jgi:hypothetical protein